MAGPRPVGDSNGGVQVSVSNADNSSVGSSGRSFVTQQFSAATEAILKRIRGEGGYLTPGTAHTLVQPPGYENVRRSVLEGMKTTLNMDVGTSIAGDQTKRTSSAGYQRMPTKPRLSKSVTSGTSTPPSTGAAAKPRSGTKTVKNKAGSKRKRIKEESDSAEESAAMSGLGGDSDSDSSGSVKQFPTQTLSGRKVVKPAQFNPAAVEGPARKRASHNYKRNGRSVEQALCKRCGRGHSPASNMIVFCDGCNIGWHQMCHDPIVPDETVKDETKEWFCNECGSKKAKSRGTSTPSAPAKVQTWQERSMEEV